VPAHDKFSDLPDLEKVNLKDIYLDEFCKDIFIVFDSLKHSRINTMILLISIVIGIYTRKGNYIEY